MAPGHPEQLQAKSGPSTLGTNKSGLSSSPVIGRSSLTWTLAAVLGRAEETLSFQAPISLSSDPESIFQWQLHFYSGKVAQLGALPQEVSRSGTRECLIKVIAFGGYLNRNQFLHTIASFPDGLDLQEARVLVAQCTLKLVEKYVSPVPHPG